jgi:P-type Mg2+ transporter
MTTPATRATSGQKLVFGEDPRFRALADASVFTVFQGVASSPRGLTEQEAADRLHRCGENAPLTPADERVAARVVAALRSPFVALLAGLGAVFVMVGDARGAVTVAVMVVLAVVLRIWQQTRSVRATRALRKLVSSTATVRRRAAADEQPLDREVSPQDLVPGDIVVLRAGDVVAANLRIVSSTDLVIDQSVLSGEALPVSKHAAVAEVALRGDMRDPVVDAPSLCLSGTAVVAGLATGVVIATGERTYSGSLARSAGALRPESSFDRGVRTVGWTLIQFMLVMAPIVFVVNGVVSGVWAQAAMFALAVAVGLTPEMLPVIVTTNLARGATRLARERVIVSRLNAIQDLGAMDVLCVDKTGTLTEDRIVYAHSIDVTGRLDDAVTEFAYLAVHFQDSAHNQLDDAIADLLADEQMPVIAADAVRSLTDHGVGVKILTGDSKSVAKQVAAQVGLDTEITILGSRIDRLDSTELCAVAAQADVFAELAPAHKTRIVAALREGGHAVGFLGDGVNDVAALRVADAGIAADTAADVAKQAADFILLDKDLAVVARGVVEGRRTLANTMKYVKITASSNFGNVLSVVAASVLLPFLSMLPIQLMVQNLLYDTAQLAIPWDRVDRDYLRIPQRWRSAGLIGFMLTFGTLSSVFDLATFAALWWLFGAGDSPATFQTGWFIEGLLTQLLVVLVLRVRTLPWRGQRPAPVVLIAAASTAAIGLLLPISPLAAALRMAAPPITYLLWLLVVTTTYAVAAHVVKQRYLRHHPTWL